MAKTEPELQAINWRRVWNVLHAYSYGKFTFNAAKARLLNAGLSADAAHHRLVATQPQGLYELARE
jgi:hypothetical protein